MEKRYAESLSSPWGMDWAELVHARGKTFCSLPYLDLFSLLATHKFSNQATEHANNISSVLYGGQWLWSWNKSKILLVITVSIIKILTKNNQNFFSKSKKARQETASGEESETWPKNPTQNIINKFSLLQTIEAQTNEAILDEPSYIYSS